MKKSLRSRLKLYSIELYRGGNIPSSPSYYPSPSLKEAPSLANHIYGSRVGDFWLGAYLIKDGAELCSSWRGLGHIYHRGGGATFMIEGTEIFSSQRGRGGGRALFITEWAEPRPAALHRKHFQTAKFQLNRLSVFFFLK